MTHRAAATHPVDLADGRISPPARPPTSNPPTRTTVPDRRGTADPHLAARAARAGPDPAQGHRRAKED